ncbi:MAG: ABC transporter ATP-binding protein [Pseudomonadota bacterium]
MDAPKLSVAQVLALFFKFLRPERSFIFLGIIYGIGISLLTLATPISVQMLINTVAFTGLKGPLIVLALTLFGLLLASGLLNALRVHLMEIFGRRFYARMVSEIALISVYAQNPFFADDGRGPLFNRYFDIVTVQRNIPILVIGAFTILLQAAVGFILTAFYHPYFIAFNGTVIALIWAIWLIWGRGAVRTAVELSHKKHNAAAWLEGLGASNGYFKSDRHVAHALTRTDEATYEYITAHKKHFFYTYSQTIAFLFLYAAASAALLGLGGWLVIIGQLTLGQLVAAELVLSAVFVGLSQLGSYLSYFYDLCAAFEELSLFYNVEQEEPSGRMAAERGNGDLSFVNVRGDARGKMASFDFHIDSGSVVMAHAVNHGIQRLVTNLLKRHVNPRGGYITFGGSDIMETEVHALRREVMVLDRPTMVEMSIRDYLRLASSQATPERITAAIKAVELEDVIARFDDGLDTMLAVTGWPLSLTETMQLKLAGAIIAQPKLLVITQLMDMIEPTAVAATIDALQESRGTTVLYFTNRDDPLNCAHFLHLDYDEQVATQSFETFHAATMPHHTPARTHIQASGQTGGPRALPDAS